MEEVFKGLVERAQYYEQFESFRNTNVYVTNALEIPLIAKQHLCT
jgi:hypothetical protein